MGPDDSNDTLSDIATALTQSVSRDGAGNMSGNFNMGSHKIVSLSNGTASSDAAAIGQIQPIDPTLTGIAALTFDATNAYLRATGPDTFVAEAAAAHATALGLGNSNSPQFVSIELNNPSDTTITRVTGGGQIAVEGVTVATATNTLTLTNKTLTSPTLNTPTINSPALTNSGNTLTLPSTTDTLVGRATTDTLTNKTLTTPTINGAALSGTLSGTPTISGALTWSSGQTFPSLTSNGTVIARSANNVQFNDATNANGFAMSFGPAGLTWAFNGGGAFLTLQTSGDLLISAAPTTLSTNSAGFRGIPKSHSDDGSSQTLALADAGGFRRMNDGGANSYTIPPNSSVAFPVGSTIELVRYGAGALTIVEGSGVTLQRGDGTSGTGTRTVGAKGIVVIQKQDTNEWFITGAFT